MNWDRRDFLKFMGRSCAGALALSTFSPLISCSTFPSKKQSVLPFEPIPPSSEDQLILAAGFRHKILLSWGELINRRGEQFGFNNDFTAFFPFDPFKPDDGLFWVNHEYPHPIFISGYQSGDTRTKSQIEAEQASLGGTMIRIRQNSAGRWEPVFNDFRNRRISALTPIPIASTRPIAGKKVAMGTLANCAGGVTPWRTVLSCEETYEDFYGERDFLNKRDRIVPESAYGWHRFFFYPPEHYGWVVEVDPFTAKSKKLTALGRFGHEGANVALTADRRCVVYMGDDGIDRCLYKFVAARPGTLETGTLYTANIEKGIWIPLDIKKTAVLQKYFKDQTEVLTYAREASKIVGGTPLARPEDVEYDPVSKEVFVALTKDKTKGNYFGSLLRLIEKDHDPSAIEFEAAVFLTGGESFSCPDNMVFDRKGNLWLTGDMSEKEMGNPPYQKFKNNGLFFIPMNGPYAGGVFQVASAPVDAEFTGSSFSPDGKTLFISVQHPGERTQSLDQPTSHWPDGGNAIPRPSVVAISGPALEKIVS